MERFALASAMAPQLGGTWDAHTRGSVSGALCSHTASTCRAANCLADYGAAVVIEATHTGELRRKAPDEEEETPPLTRRHSLDNWHDLRELTDANTRRRSMDVRAAACPLKDYRPDPTRRQTILGCRLLAPRDHAACKGRPQAIVTTLIHL